MVSSKREEYDADDGEALHKASFGKPEQGLSEKVTLDVSDCIAIKRFSVPNPPCGTVTEEASRLRLKSLPVTATSPVSPLAPG